MTRSAVVAACAITVVGVLSAGSPATAGKKPGGSTPPPPPPTTTATSYGGSAQVVDADLTVLGLVGGVGAAVDLVRVGPLPATGGLLDASLAQVAVPGPPLFLAASVASASTAGAGDRSHASASVADASVGLGALAPSVLRIEAGVLRSSATARCGATGAELSGASEVVSLRIGVGTQSLVDRAVTTEPNQVIDIPGVARITVNEQTRTASSITVSALHVELVPPGSPLGPVVTGDVVVSRSSAAITCQAGDGPPPPCQVTDFVTGGGQIGAKAASFGMVGGTKPNGLSGHLNLRSKAGPHLKGTAVTAYEVVSPTSRRLTYSGTQDGSPVTIVATITDNGEGSGATVPDTISVTTSGGYGVSGDVGGNIQLHTPKGCGTTTTTPPKRGRG